jgi:hypothetical protein
MSSNIYNNKFWNFTHVLFLLILTLACFWPLAFGIFSAKNDNIIQFLPVRFHVTEALRSGHLPLWTPYMYLGYPIHGDMQGGAWNPVVWVLSLFGRYNLTSLHCEILFYVFMAGIGMYRFLSAIGVSPILCLMGASAFLMCGYITDVAGSNLPFLAAAAYIPFIFAFYFQLTTTFSWNYALKTSVFLTLLFVSGYPSFFICTCYVLVAAFLVVLIRNKIKGINSDFKKLVLAQILMVIAFLALSAPAIISYWEILPHYQRGSGVSLNAALENGFHPFCSLSFLFPTAPVKDPATAATDLISKNGYFNSFLVIFLLSYVWTKKTFFQTFILSGIIFFFLFSLGNYTPLRTWCYELIPLMNTFRHPANARLFVIIGSIVLGITTYQNFITGLLFVKYPIIISMALLSIVLIFVFFSIPHASIEQKINGLFHQATNVRSVLKDFLNSLDYNDVVVLNGLAQIIFLGLFIILLGKTNKQLLLTLIFILNSFVFAQFSVPFTLASKTAPQTINNLIKNFPAGFPLPDQKKSISDNSADALAYFNTIGIQSFYNKKIATVDIVFTPTFMTQMEKAYSDNTVRNTMLSHPYAYFGDSQNPASFELKKFWNNSFQFNTNTGDTSVFYLQQLFLPGWKGFIDNKKVTILKANSAFMAIAIPKGRHEIKFIYQPAGIVASLILSFSSFLAVIVLLLKNILRANKR